MTEDKLYLIRGKLRTTSSLTEAEAYQLLQYISDLEEMLDETDEDEYFGYETWRDYYNG